MEYGSSSYMKVIGSRSRSREQKNRRKSPFRQCKTSIGINSNNSLDFYNTYSRERLRAAWGFGYGGSNDVIAIFVT